MPTRSVLPPLWLACLSLPALLALRPAQEPTPNPARGPLVVCADGLTIPWDQYAEHLIERSGRRPLEELLDLLLLRREAARRGLEAAPEGLAAALEARFEELEQGRHRGDREAFEAELAEGGYDRASYRALIAEQLEREALEGLIAKAARSLERPALLQRFEREYGPGGQTLRVRHLLLTRAQTRAALIAAGERPESLDVARVDQRIRALLTEYRQRLADGADFGALARESSHDGATHQTGGEIPSYRGQHFGPAFGAAVAEASAGQLIGPIESEAGWHLIEVLERRVVRFEEVEAELLRRQREDPATGAERLALRERLRREAGPEFRL